MCALVTFWLVGVCCGAGRWGVVRRVDGTGHGGGVGFVVARTNARSANVSLHETGASRCTVHSCNLYRLQLLCGVQPTMCFIRRVVAAGWLGKKW